ncbi:Papain family cysteine protease, partial [Trichostrongylus colubriformis]
MSDKDRRVLSTEQKRSQCNRRLLITAIALSILGVVILLMAGFLYLRSAAAEAEWKQSSDEYLRKLVQQVNDNPNLLWKAKYNRFGVKHRSYGFEYTRNATAVQEAVAAAGVASDRACIKSNGTYKASLSEEDILGCCAVCGNCYGGDPLKALVYWVNEGIVTGGRDGCRPYSFDLSCGVPCSPATFPGAEKNRICVRRCQDIYYQNKYDDDKHYASMAYSMYPRTMTVASDGSVRAQVPTIIGHLNKTSSTPMNIVQIRNILKKEIALFGPMTMAFPVSEEFLHYAS